MQVIVWRDNLYKSLGGSNNIDHMGTSTIYGDAYVPYVLEYLDGVSICGLK